MSVSGGLFNLVIVKQRVVPGAAHLFQSIWPESASAPEGSSVRKDSIELHLGSVIRQCVFIRCTTQRASINLHRLSKHSHELFSLDKRHRSFFLSLLILFLSLVPFLLNTFWKWKVSVKNHLAITFPLFFFVFYLHKWALWVILACWFFVLSLSLWFLLSYVRSEVRTAERLSTADWPTYCTTANPYGY